ESFRNDPHNGIDFLLTKNTDVYAIQDGVVSKVLTVEDKTGFGNAIFIKLQNGKELLFAHLNKVFVKEGETVDYGDLIGLSGNTGNVVGESGGFHLHLGLKENGQWINPEQYIPIIQKMGDKMIQYTNEFQRLD